MFLGAIPRRPDKAEAMKQLRSHVTMFGVFVSLVRVTPYILHYFCEEKEVLTLDTLGLGHD